jgi:hypothetical protein
MREKTSLRPEVSSGDSGELSPSLLFVTEVFASIDISFSQ